jgi:hypothetical protein
MTPQNDSVKSDSSPPALAQKYEVLLRDRLVLPPNDFLKNVVTQLSANPQSLIPISRTVKTEKAIEKATAKTSVAFYFRCTAMALGSALAAIEVFTLLFSFWAANTAL